MKLLNALVNVLSLFNKGGKQTRSQVGRIVGLSLVRANVGYEVAKLDNGTKVYLNGTDPEFTIVARTSTSLRGVRFDWNGRQGYQTDRTPPYALCGGSYDLCITLQEGRHRVTAVTLNNNVPYSVDFEIIAGTMAPTMAPSRIANVKPPTNTARTGPPATKAPATAPVGADVPVVTNTASPVSSPTLHGTAAPTVYSTAVPTSASTPTFNPTLADTPTFNPTLAETPTFNPTLAETPTFTPTVLPTSPAPTASTSTAQPTVPMCHHGVSHGRSYRVNQRCGHQ
jgi:hypothetical protein